MISVDLAFLSIYAFHFLISTHFHEINEQLFKHANKCTASTPKAKREMLLILNC